MIDGDRPFVTLRSHIALRYLKFTASLPVMVDLVTTAFIWGFSFALAKKALNNLSPYELVTIRLALGALTVFILTNFSAFRVPRILSGSAKKSFKREKLKVAFLIGLFEFASTYILYTWSLKFLPSGVVGTLTLLTPVLTYSVSMLAGISKWSGKALLSISLSILGAALCFPMTRIFAGFHPEASAVTGFMLIMISNLFFAVGNVIITKTERRGLWTQSLTFHGLGVGALLALMACFVFPAGNYSRFSDYHVWLLPFYLGIVATGLGFFLWNRGVQKVSATAASVVGNFKAPFSILWGALLLGESVSWSLMAGLLCLLAAVQVLPKKI